MENYLSCVLEQYNLQNKTATLTGHNETMAFNVADLFLVKIHKSNDSFNSDFMYQNILRKDLYNCEVQVLLFLKKLGLNVQCPVANKYGEYVTCLDDGCFVTVFEWIKGRTACEQDLTEEFCIEFGKTVANLHNVSSGFSSDHILKYDTSFCDILLTHLDSAYKKEYFKKEHYNILLKVCNDIKSAFGLYNNEFTVIHGDLSLSNTLIASTGLYLIDFSLFGLGHPMIDVACIYSFITDKKLQESFKKGYENHGNKINTGIIDLCYAFNEIMGIMLHIDKLATESWFDNWLDGLCNRIFIPVVEKRGKLWTELNV